MDITKPELFKKIEMLASECHQLACAQALGGERVELFDIYNVLHNLLRTGYESQISAQMNPLLSHQSGDDNDDWDDEDDD